MFILIEPQNLPHNNNMPVYIQIEKGKYVKLIYKDNIGSIPPNGYVYNYSKEDGTIYKIYSSDKNMSDVQTNPNNRNQLYKTN